MQQHLFIYYHYYYLWLNLDPNTMT